MPGCPRRHGVPAGPASWRVSCKDRGSSPRPSFSTGPRRRRGEIFSAHERNYWIISVNDNSPVRPRRVEDSPKVAMSFRLFIYYCALLGGAAAFGGWVV